MAVRISSKTAGFRRCGVAHPAEPTTYPDDKFSATELKQLQDEPMLIVDVIPEKEKAKPDAPSEAKAKGKTVNKTNADDKTDAKDGNEQPPVEGKAGAEGVDPASKQEGIE